MPDTIERAGGAGPEAERQLTAAAERHREVVTSMQETGRPEAAAAHEETERLQGLAQRILADVADDQWSPAPTDLADLHDRLDTEWRAWRHALERRQP